MLLRLLENGRTWVKLSAPYEWSKAGPPNYTDVGQLAYTLSRAAPDRMLWATNWPHPTPGLHKPDDAWRSTCCWNGCQTKRRATRHWSTIRPGCMGSDPDWTEFRSRMNIVGVDIGGTFTDLVGCVDGRIVTSKTSTVPADPTRGVADSLALAHCEMPALSELLHGSTIAINTVLERKGARTALITTRGFRDTYAIGRGNRIEAFNLFFHRPKPLIPRELTFEVTERMNAKGEVLTAARRGRGAGAGEDARGAEHRGGRGVLPARLCQSGA